MKQSGEQHTKEHFSLENSTQKNTLVWTKNIQKNTEVVPIVAVVSVLLLPLLFLFQTFQAFY